MSVRGYCAKTSVAQGGRLDLHLADDGGGTDAILTVRRVVTGETVRTLTVHVDPHPIPADPALDHQWPVAVRLPISPAWSSGLYTIDLSPGDDAGPLFVVTPADPGSDADILLAVPFPTYHAYAYIGGTPGASVYWNEQPDRARRVSVRRPFSVDMQWEERILRWLADSGPPVEYCSGYDLARRACPAGALPPPRVRGPRRVLVGGHARRRRGVGRRGWQRRVPDGQHLLVAVPPRGRGPHLRLLSRCGGGPIDRDTGRPRDGRVGQCPGQPAGEPPSRRELPARRRLLGRPGQDGQRCLDHAIRRPLGLRRHRTDRRRAVRTAHGGLRDRRGRGRRGAGRSTGDGP